MVKNIENLLEKLEINYKDLSLYKQAFTHRSYANEVSMQGITCLDYDRLEFLGDAIIYAAIASFLYDKFPNYSSGELTKKRKFVIEGTSLSFIAENLDFESYIRYSKGEVNNSANHKKVLEDVFEALVGAISVDLGKDKAMEFTIRILGDYLSANETLSLEEDAKSKLQIIIEKDLKIKPTYKTNTIYTDKNKFYFETECYVNSVIVGKGIGTNKKQAEQEAAKDALNHYVNIA